MSHRSNASVPALCPLLVRPLSGRSGTTAMMQLLGSSNEIAFTRRYPFEDRWTEAIVDMASSLGRDEPPVVSDTVPARLARRLHDLAYGPVREPGTVFRDTDLHVDRLRRAAFDGAWSALAEQEPDARFVAEKSDRSVAARLAGWHLDHRSIHLARDPRDIWASITAFDRRRGYYGFGRERHQSRSSFLQSWLLEAVRRAALFEESPNDRIVRYEDLVSAPSDVAEDLGRWLDVRLDPAALRLSDHPQHRTSVDLQGSVGRWRRDVAVADVRAIEDALGDFIAARGYA